MIKLEKSNPQPLYLQLQDKLRREVIGGHFKVDAAIPDERTLARTLGLSRMTVRRAILALTDEGLFTRIRGKGTFVAAPAQKPPTRSSLKTIGIIAPFGQAESTASLFYYRVLQGIYNETEGAGVNVSVRKATAPYGAFMRSLREDREISALIVLGLVNQELLSELQGETRPVVLVDSAQPGLKPSFDSVTHEAEETSFNAVISLLNLGHQEVGLMNYTPLTDAARSRQAGYERALTS
jgi:DNA-binding transcriptional regulator YhcF (GntR family)